MFSMIHYFASRQMLLIAMSLVFAQAVFGVEQQALPDQRVNTCEYVDTKTGSAAVISWDKLNELHSNNMWQYRREKPEGHFDHLWMVQCPGYSAAWLAKSYCIANSPTMKYLISQDVVEDLILAGEVEQGESSLLIDCGGQNHRTKDRYVCTIKDPEREPMIYAQEEVIRRLSSNYKEVPRSSEEGLSEIVCGRRHIWMEVPDNELISKTTSKDTLCVLMNVKTRAFRTFQWGNLKEIPNMSGWERKNKKPNFDAYFVGKVECPRMNPWWLVQRKKAGSVCLANN